MDSTEREIAMRKRILTALVAMVMATAMSLTAFAGTWQKDSVGWWWENDDSSYPVSSWQWLDGDKDGVAECYYFNEAGYMLANTITPDGYQVNANGAWVVDGAVQTKQATFQTAQQPQQTAQMQKTEHTVIEIPAGTYLVGQDIPAGQYVAVNDGYCYVKIGADPNMDTLYSSESTSYCIPFEVREGDWIYSSEGMIYSIDDVSLDLSKSGMYVVGKHIKAGDYILEARGSGYYCITRGMLGQNDKIEKNDNFETIAYVSLKDGQCIEVSRCSNNFVAP